MTRMSTSKALAIAHVMHVTIEEWLTVRGRRESRSADICGIFTKESNASLPGQRKSVLYCPVYRLNPNRVMFA